MRPSGGEPPRRMSTRTDRLTVTYLSRSCGMWEGDLVGSRRHEKQKLLTPQAASTCSTLATACDSLRRVATRAASSRSLNAVTTSIAVLMIESSSLPIMRKPDDTVLAEAGGRVALIIVDGSLGRHPVLLNQELKSPLQKGAPESRGSAGALIGREAPSDLTRLIIA